MGNYSNLIESFRGYVDIRLIVVEFLHNKAMEELQYQDTFLVKYFSAIQNLSAAFALTKKFQWPFACFYLSS